MRLTGSAIALLGNIGLATAFFVAPVTIRQRSHLHSLAPEALATEGDWTAYLDEETTGLIYYFNSQTGESRWEAPSDTFPSVTLDRKTKRLAREKREEYRMSRKEEPKKGLFRSFLESKMKDDVEEELKVAKETVQEQPDWLPESMVTNGATTKTKTVDQEKEQLASSTFFTDLFSKYVAADEPINGGTAQVEVAQTQEKQQQTEKTQQTSSSLFGSLFSTATPTLDETSTEEVKEAPKQIVTDIGGHLIPHPAKVSWGGEDAFFVKGRTFGVFDGVSGAEKLAGVPIYSTTMAEEMLRNVGNKGMTMNEIIKTMTDAAEFCDRAATGGTTAIMASIQDDGFLRVLNLGDSTCIVVRNGRVTAQTREIMHAYECPYQLSDISGDRPKDGTRLNVELVPGDIVIMGSDGIFDNLTNEQVLQSIPVNGSRKPSQVIAKAIVNEAYKVSKDRKAPTPFAKLAKRQGDVDFADGVGGKLDDISCVVLQYG